MRMRSVLNTVWLSLPIAIACVGSAAIACSDGNGDDAASANDADGGVIADADTGSDDADGGVPPEAGVCGCSYGFHQECGPGELCMEAYEYDSPTCTRAAPRGGEGAGGCTTTSTALSAACNAQCAPAVPRGSPCGEMNFDAVAAVIGSWRGAINNATINGSGNEWEAMRSEDIEGVRSTQGLSRECIDFLGWTMLGVVELCRGNDAVRHPESWERFEQRLFKVLRSPDDDCLISAGNLCMSAIEGGVLTGTIAANGINNVLMACPSGLPYAAPCTGADALACVKARIATIIRPLYFR